MPAPVINICVLLIIEFRLNILRESRDVTDVFFSLKIELWRNLFKVTITSFKNVISCPRNG